MFDFYFSELLHSSSEVSAFAVCRTRYLMTISLIHFCLFEKILCYIALVDDWNVYSCSDFYLVIQICSFMSTYVHCIYYPLFSFRAH